MKNKWFKRILLGLIIGFLIVRILRPDLFFINHDIRCFLKKEMEKTDLNGIVVKKFLDYENHGCPKIEFKSITNGKIIEVNFVREESGFFNNIQIGDTVYKKVGSLKIISSNKNLRDSLFYNCQK
jgi:hypothetical protein